MIGDSQEACPLSHGLYYVPALNAALADRYGVSPRTPLVQAGLSFNAPLGEWLVSGALLSPAVAPEPPPLSLDALPGLAWWALPAPAADQRGWALVLQPTASGVNADVPIDRTRPWLDASQGVYLDVYAGGPPAGGIRVAVSRVPTEAPAAAGEPLGIWDILPAQPQSPAVVRHRVGPLPWSIASGGALQAEFIGADPLAPARLVSASFVSVAADVGVTVTDIAAGGYTAASLLNAHADALPHLGALDADAAIITFGANDIWFPPPQFRQNLLALIAAIRSHTAPDFPIVIFTDPCRGWSTPVADAWAEQFPRICAEIAADHSAVCAVNARRLTHEQGWTLSDILQFTTDRVHYNPQGASLKAALEVTAIWDTFVCLPDIGVQGGLPGDDGALDNNDFIAFIGAFFAHRPLADVGRQGGIAGGDGRFDNNDFVAFIDAFFAGCP